VFVNSLKNTGCIAKHRAKDPVHDARYNSHYAHQRDRALTDAMRYGWHWHRMGLCTWLKMTQLTGLKLLTAGLIFILMVTGVMLFNAFCYVTA